MEYGVNTQYWHFSNRRGWVVRERTIASIACPLCEGPLYSVQRQLIDRLLNFRRHRFQCVSQVCRWEGDLPTES